MLPERPGRASCPSPGGPRHLQVPRQPGQRPIDGQRHVSCWCCFNALVIYV